MTEARITTETRGRVFLIGLNRAEKYNAFDLRMLRELGEAFTRYEDDEDLWCAVLFGHGEHFTSGLDLGEVGPEVAKGASLFDPSGVDPLQLSGRIRTKPLITVVHGWCLTIGIELMLASDIRIAASDTKLGQIEIKRGILPFGGATLRWPAVSGWGNAMRYLLTGDTFTAGEALRIGLVQEVVEDGHLEAAIALAQRVAAQAPLGVRATLASARQAVVDGQEAAASDLMRHAMTLFSSDDAKEGVASFLERREAKFTGR
jgi:enoyl-CoA hydratase/carnithine racemase